jgi:hypothetical protein
VPRSSTRRRAAAAAAALGLAAAAAGPVGAADPSADNPCHGPKRDVLLCPNLQMSPPGDLWIEKTSKGRTLLHARNSINSRGRGPAELRGRPHGPFTMTAKQGIHGTDGKVRIYDTGAWLGWKSIPGQNHYWKFRDAGIFEIWSLDEHGRPKKLKRTGEKQYYCLRDLVHTKPGGRSPSHAVYPACSQDHDAARVKLGTSVGWSDVYPSTYYEQYIDVTGLSGKYGFFQTADPENGLWETDEHDNAGETVVSLPSGKVIRTFSRVDRPAPGRR